MAYFAPHDGIIRHLERSTGRSDGQQLFDALVLRGLLRPWEGVEGFWGIEALGDETWRLLGESVKADE
jgi:hypothetical protein